MLKTLLVTSGFIAVSIFGSCLADDQHNNMEPHRHEAPLSDSRISLGLNPHLKGHQLAIMREHLGAVNTILLLLAESKFREASKVAHTKLGMTPEMQAMCISFHNEHFTALGLAFHRSGDELGDVLQTGDSGASLRALNKTMQFCVECHATFRQ